MKAALYIRISTDEKYGKQDPETQRLPLHEYCKLQGWEVIEEYLDDISAVKVRPSFDRMLKDAKDKKFDVLVGVKLDRMFRSVKDCVLTVEELNKLGIRFVAVTQGIDTDKKSAVGMLTIHILAAIAEFERALISERVKAGIERRKSQGKKYGGRARKLIPEGIKQWQSEEVVSIDAIRRMKKHLTTKQIAEKLGCNRNLVSKVLREKS